MSQYNQPFMTFVEAGYNAFRLAYSTGHYAAPLYRPYRIDNPYSKKPFNKLWKRGWDEAQREFDGETLLSNFRRVNPFENNVRVKEFVRQIELRERFKNRKQFDPSKTRSQGPHPAAGRVFTKSNAPSVQRKLPVNLGKLNSLNKKYRTVA